MQFYSVEQNHHTMMKFSAAILQNVCQSSMTDGPIDKKNGGREVTEKPFTSKGWLNASLKSLNLFLQAYRMHYSKNLCHGVKQNTKQNAR